MKTNTMTTANAINNETTTIKFTLGSIVYNEGSTMPQMELLANGEVFGYLSPFRGYCFQVSEDTKGNCDLGASEIVDIKTVVDALPGKAETLLKGLAITALIKAVGTSGALNIGGFHKASTPNGVTYVNDMVDEFIHHVMNWVSSK